MGFLFDMLQKAEGSICQATNLLKTLSNHPQGMLSTRPLSHITVLTTAVLSWAAGSSRGGSSRVILRNHAAGLDEVPVRQDGPGLPFNPS